MSKMGCELCSNPARMFCESNQASLCWDCDEKVHSANFVVAKHSRTLLCHICSSPMLWKATALKLGPTVSVCCGCVDDVENRGASSSRREDEDGCDSQESKSDDGEYYSDSDDFSEGEEDDEDEDGENQVVPWSDSGSNLPSVATTAASSIGSEQNFLLSSSKRTHPR